MELCNKLYNIETNVKKLQEAVEQISDKLPTNDKDTEQSIISNDDMVKLIKVITSLEEKTLDTLNNKLIEELEKLKINKKINDINEVTTEINKYVKHYRVILNNEDNLIGFEVKLPHQVLEALYPSEKEGTDNNKNGIENIDTALKNAYSFKEEYKEDTSYDGVFWQWIDLKILLDQLSNNIQYEFSDYKFPSFDKKYKPFNILQGKKDKREFDRETNFLSCQFLSDVDFMRCEFDKKVSFNLAEFCKDKKAKFKHTRFEDVSYFRKTYFNGDTDFEACFFANATFDEVTFPDKEEINTSQLFNTILIVITLSLTLFTWFNFLNIDLFDFINKCAIWSITLFFVVIIIWGLIYSIKSEVFKAIIEKRWIVFIRYIVLFMTSVYLVYENVIKIFNKFSLYNLYDFLYSFIDDYTLSYILFHLTKWFVVIYLIYFTCYLLYHLYKLIFKWTYKWLIKSKQQSNTKAIHMVRVTMKEMIWSDFSSAYDVQEIDTNRETLARLKESNNNKGNFIDANLFFAAESNQYLKKTWKKFVTLPVIDDSNKDHNNKPPKTFLGRLSLLPDIISFVFAKYTSNYGTSWVIPLAWILLIVIGFSSTFAMNKDFKATPATPKFLLVENKGAKQTNNYKMDITILPNGDAKQEVLDLTKLKKLNSIQIQTQSKFTANSDETDKRHFDYYNHEFDSDKRYVLDESHPITVSVAYLGNSAYSTFFAKEKWFETTTTDNKKFLLKIGISILLLYLLGAFVFAIKNRTRRA